MKKKILIITTGGTLACVKSDNGLQPGMSSEEILSYITDITEFYEVDFYELFQLDSANIHPENWEKMAQVIYEKYNDYDGKNDYQFMLDMYNKRNKSNITEQQHRKIRGLIAYSIKPFLRKRLKYK